MKAVISASLAMVRVTRFLGGAVRATGAVQVTHVADQPRQQKAKMGSRRQGGRRNVQNCSEADGRGEKWSRFSDDVMTECGKVFHAYHEIVVPPNICFLRQDLIL